MLIVEDELMKIRILLSVLKSFINDRNETSFHVNNCEFATFNSKVEDENLVFVWNVNPVRIHRLRKYPAREMPNDEQSSRIWSIWHRYITTKHHCFRWYCQLQPLSVGWLILKSFFRVYVYEPLIPVYISHKHRSTSNLRFFSKRWWCTYDDSCVPYIIQDLANLENLLFT